MDNKLLSKNSTRRTLEIECLVVIAILPNPRTFPCLLSPNVMQSLGQLFFSKDVNILLSPIIRLVHPLSSTQLVPLEEYAYKKKLSFVFRYLILVGSFQVSNKALGHPHTSL
jgi:hypothetical protein